MSFSDRKKAETKQITNIKFYDLQTMIKQLRNLRWMWPLCIPVNQGLGARISTRIRFELTGVMVSNIYRSASLFIQWYCWKYKFRINDMLLILFHNWNLDWPRWPFLSKYIYKKINVRNWKINWDGMYKIWSDRNWLYLNPVLQQIYEMVIHM